MASTKRKPAKGKPITSHPLFPAVVALWFGALFGLGSLAIRPSLFEGLVVRSGIDLIVPAAAPPLGVTARILIALVMSSLGALLGVLLAWRMLRPKAEVRQRKRGATVAGETVRRPISAHDELGDSLDGAAAQAGFVAGRRRPLAVDPEDVPFEPIDFAPLPGGQPQIFDIAAARLTPVEEAQLAPVEEMPLDLGAFPLPAAPEPAAVQPIPPAPAVAAAPFAAPQGQIPAQPAPFAFPGTEPLPAAAPAATAATTPIATNIPNGAGPTTIFGVSAIDGHVPTEFVRAAGFKTSVFDPEPAQPLFADRPLAAAVETAPSPVPVAAPAEPEHVQPVSAALADAPAAAMDPLPSPAGLGMTDLAQRLQESMARRRAARAAAPEPDSAPAPVAEPPASVSEAPAEAAPVIPAFAPTLESVPEIVIPPAPIPLPEAFRPIGFGLVEEDDSVDLGSLAPRHLSMPESPAPAPEAVEAEPAPAIEPVAAAPEAAEADEPDVGEEVLEPAQEEAFGSLLGIAPAAPRNSFVRIDEPEPAAGTVEPVVIFPGQGTASAAPFAAPIPAVASAPAVLRPFDKLDVAGLGSSVSPTLAPAIDPAEAEQALRAALASLQRMSGAA